MKKVLIICALALSLGGCGTTLTNLQNTIEDVFTPQANVVTKNDLYAFENSMTLAFAGLNAYKKSCQGGAIGTSCYSTIAKIQGYTTQIPAILSNVRTFVKNNDQVNAVTYFNEAKSLLSQFEAIATANGIKVS